MAFSKITNQELNSRGATTLPNQPKISATALKQEFDAPAKNIVAPKFNNLIDELEATTAAASLGAVAPSGQTGETVQDVIDSMAAETHTHANKALLDTYTQTEADLASAVADDHTHSNKTLLDNLSESSGSLLYDNDALMKADGSNSTAGFVDKNVNDLTNYYTKTGVDAITGSLSDLVTFAKSNLVAAINEVKIAIGSKVSNAFKSIKVGLTTLTASGEATLELKAGSNVTLTPDATDNSITINATGGGQSSGDMLSADYDSTYDVKTAGGIPAYVAANAMTTNGSNAASAVNFSGSFTVGSRQGTVGTNSSVKGDHCTASGDNSHAEGSFTTASASCAHAEGASFSTASGFASHAEGGHCTASGYESHAEGGDTTASGDYSHAEGEYTIASGDCSHAGGYYTEAAEDYQTVVGKYNASSSNALFVVGNGTGTNAKSNAFEVWKNGNVSFDGGATRFQMRRLKETITLSTSSTTDATFTDSTLGKYINSDAVLSVYTDIFGMNPTNIVVSGHTCTVTFPQVDTAVTLNVVLEIAGTMSQIIT